MAKLTVLGIERYLNYSNDSLFKNLVFPVGVDKNLAVNTCLLRSGEFEALYPDADFLKEQITIWGQRYYKTFTKWVEGFDAEFNPIENYDRLEKWTDSHDTTFTHGKKETITYGKDETTQYGKSEDVTNGKTVTTTNEVSAYNATGYSADNKSTSSNTGTDSTVLSGSDSVTLSGSDSTQATGSDRDAGSITHEARIHGNIGVTTAPEMLKQYTEFYKNFNLYDLIADTFVSEFCLMVY